MKNVKTETRLLAERIAMRLFTRGDGKVANRLELKDENERGMGGWGFGPAVDQVEAELLNQSTKER